MDNVASEAKWRIVAMPLVAFFLIIVDQLSKSYAVTSGNYTLNTGISFGLLAGIGNINTAMIIVASIALVFFIYLLAFRSEQLGMHGSLLLLIAGTAGNLIDRITTGAVIDFIDIGSFPTFNFADAYLTIGIAIILIVSIIDERRTNDASERS